MSKIPTLLLLLALAGCATGPQTPDVVKVPVPSQAPKVRVPNRPHLPISDLRDESPPAVVQKALVQSLGILMSDDAALRKLLQPYAQHRCAQEGRELECQ